MKGTLMKSLKIGNLFSTVPSLNYFQLSGITHRIHFSFVAFQKRNITKFSQFLPNIFSTQNRFFQSKLQLKLFPSQTFVFQPKLKVQRRTLKSTPEEDQELLDSIRQNSQQNSVIEEIFKIAEHILLKNEKESTEEIIKEILDYAETQSSGFHMIGNIYSKINRFDKALEYFDKAIQSDQMNLDAHFDKALAYMTLRDTQSARKCFSKIKELEPTGMFLLQNGVDPESLSFLTRPVSPESEEQDKDKKETMKKLKK